MSRAAGDPVTVDLRSDTVTVPTEAMRRAMAQAEVGDDVYGEDPTVIRLEETVARLTGMEAGLFVPSGTMSNQVALAVHCQRGAEVVLPEGAHIFEYEPGAMAVISGLLPRLVPVVRGVPTVDDVRAAIRRSKHQAPTGLICLENTHNTAGGTVVPLERQRAVQEIARENGLPVHLDGARAFNAATALGVAVSEVCAGFDSVSVCLSKSIGAPVGSVLLGSTRFIEQAHRYRKLLGGGMRQAGVLAAAALVALETTPQLLVHDHRRARRLAEGLVGVPGLALDMDAVQTNMVYLTVVRHRASSKSLGAAEDLADACAVRGVRFNAMGPNTVRLVTHHQVSDAQVEYALSVIAEEAARLAGSSATAAEA